MKIIDELAESAQKSVDKSGEKWLDKALDEAGKLIPEITEGISAFEEVAAIEAAHALKSIRNNKSQLARLGSRGLAAALTWAAVGQDDRLKQIKFLKEQAEWADLHAATDAGANRVIEARRDIDAIKATLSKIGKRAIQAALPFLLAVL